MTPLSFFARKRIVITGSSGYLGSRLIERLSQVRCELVCVSRKKSIILPMPTKGSLTCLQGNVADRHVWARVLGRHTDIVFHLAAQTSVQEAEINPAADAKVNVESMRHLLETCRLKHLSPIVVYAGTATQAGLPAVKRLQEHLPDQPITVYDVHKLIAEQYLKSYAKLGIVRGCSLRLFNVYGPGPESSSGSRGILNQMIRRALRGEPLTVYGTGRVMRDYIYVDDVIEAFCKAAASIARTNGRHFNIGSGKGMMLSDAFRLVAKLCGQTTGRKIPVRTVRPPQKLPLIDTRSYVADTTAFKGATGWKPSISLTEGIRQTVQYFQDNQ